MAVAIEPDADLMRLGRFSGRMFPRTTYCEPASIAACACRRARRTGSPGRRCHLPRGRLWLMRAVPTSDSIFSTRSSTSRCTSASIAAPARRSVRPACTTDHWSKPLALSLEQHRPRPLRERALRRAGLDWLFADSRRLRLLVRMLRLSEKSGYPRSLARAAC